MGLREDVEKIEKRADNLEKSFALEMLQDCKAINKRIVASFTGILIILIISFFVIIGLFLKYINEIETVEYVTDTKTQEIQDIDTIENSTIINGDTDGYYKTN